MHWYDVKLQFAGKAPPMVDRNRNLLLDNVEYQYETTNWGTWRRFRGVDGELFEEFRSNITAGDLPLLHITRGRNPETGRRITARGIIAVGRFATGVVAIGQVSFGLIAIGQAAFGILFGLGQLSTGLACVGQLAIGFAIGIGQFATGTMAIGQVAFGQYVFAQVGLGQHVWDTRAADPAAVQFFRGLFPFL